MCSKRNGTLCPRILPNYIRRGCIPPIFVKQNQCVFFALYSAKSLAYTNTMDKARLSAGQEGEEKHGEFLTSGPLTRFMLCQSLAWWQECLNVRSTTFNWKPHWNDNPRIQMWMPGGWDLFHHEANWDVFLRKWALGTGAFPSHQFVASFSLRLPVSSTTITLLLSHPTASNQVVEQLILQTPFLPALFPNSVARQACPLGLPKLLWYSFLLWEVGNPFGCLSQHGD